LKKAGAYPRRLIEDETPTPPIPDEHAKFVIPTRLAGEDLSRILSLSDGVFAFAMTLLVLSLTVPLVPNATTRPAAEVSGRLAYLLQHDWTVFVAYGFAFVMIGIWWVVHNRTFQYIARYDSPLVWINLAMLMQIAVMPFVLSVFSDYSSTQTGVCLFAGIQVTLGLTSTLLWDYARRQKLLKPSVPIPVQKYFTRRGYFTSLVFAASIGVTFVSIPAAEALWFLTFVVQRYLVNHGE
jgi:uncharacterized membrane protein